MKYPTRIYYTETDKTMMWDRWQKGEFTLPSRVAYLVADRKTHRARRRELSLQLLRDGPPEGQRKTMRQKQADDA